MDNPWTADVIARTLQEIVFSKIPLIKTTEMKENKASLNQLVHSGVLENIIMAEKKALKMGVDFRSLNVVLNVFGAVDLLLNQGDDYRLNSDAETIQNVFNETFLTLHKLDSAQFPECICYLNNLEELDASSNGLKSISTSIDRLTKLKYLDLCYNEISVLPQSFHKLIQLEELDLSRNVITTLPDNFGKLVNLNQLELKDNFITQLPLGIGDCASLVYLGLADNRITGLPQSIGNLCQIQTLDLYNNKLSKLPPTIGNLKELIRLNLSYNNLTTLPPEIANLKKLNYLYLKGNSIPKHNKTLTELIENGVCVYY